VHRTALSFACALALTASSFLTGCDGGGGDPTDPNGNGPTPTISMSLSSSSINVTAGTSGDVTVTVTRGGGYTGAVTVSADAITGVTVQPLTIATGSTTGTLTVQVAASVAAGTLQATIRGSGTGVQQVSATLQIQVAAAPVPEFSLVADPATLTVQQGQAQTSQIQITRSGGFTGAVTLAAEGLPTGVTAAFDPAAPTANASTLTLTAAAGAAVGTSNVTVKGTGTGVTGEKTATVALTVEAPPPTGDFSLSLDPGTLQFQQGANAGTTVTISRTGGFTGSVALSATGLPSGVTAAFDPASTDGTTSALTLTASGSAATGAATVTVTGTASGLGDRTVDLGVTVSDPGTGGSGNAAWAFCDEIGIPVWFAFRDGNGPWTRVQGDAQNVFRFQIDQSRGSIAWVEVVSGSPEMQVFHYSRAELTTVGEDQCGGPSGFKTVNGSVQGLGALESAFISLGSASTAVGMGGSSNFLLEMVEDGPQDLIAASVEFSTTTFTQQPNRIIIRRDLNPPDNSSLAPLNFSTEGFAPASANLTVNGLTSSEMAVLSGLFTTARGGLGSFFSGISGGASRTYWGIPTAELATGDLHYLQVVSVDTVGSGGPTSPSTRQVGLGFREVQDRTATLGPALTLPTVATVATAPYARFGAEWNIQAEYSRFFMAAFIQTAGGADDRMVTMGATEGFLGGGGSAELTVPDFSGVAGWNNAWGLQAGIATVWTVSGTGWQGSGVINFPDLAEGTQFFSASRSGQITP
jgi:hypothetical protein